MSVVAQIYGNRAAVHDLTNILFLGWPYIPDSAKHSGLIPRVAEARRGVSY
jgi:hypothetical protein